MSGKKYYSIKEVAARLGVSENTVRKLIVKENGIKAHNIGTGDKKCRYSISEAELDSYLKRVEIKPVYSGIEYLGG